MTEKDPRIEAYFSGLSDWSEELLALRAILGSCPLTEQYKWSSPVYTVNGRNVAILGGFRDFAALGFFKGVLLKDAAGLLVAPGRHSRSARVARFTDVNEIFAKEVILRACITEAIEIERTGRKVDLGNDRIDYPVELLERMDGDPELKAAFLTLTPGRQRGYCIHFARPKQSKTRVARIERSRPRILAGKGLQDR